MSCHAGRGLVIGGGEKGRNIARKMVHRRSIFYDVIVDGKGDGSLKAKMLQVRRKAKAA